MSDFSQGDGWWVASNGKWYAPELHPDYVAPAAPASPTPPAAEAAPMSPVVNEPAPVSPVADSVYENPASLATPGPTFESPASSSMPSELASASSASPATVAAVGEPAYVLPDVDADAEAKSRRGLVLGLAGVVVLVAVGFLLFRLFGGGGGTGASSPEAAVDQLFDSISEGDIVGIAELFDPDEAEGWVGSFVPVTEKIAELSGADNLAATEEFDETLEELLKTFDLEITGPGGDEITYDVRELDAEGRIARVRIQGLDITLTASEADRALVFGTPDAVVAVDSSRVDGAGVELREEGDGIATRAFAPDQDTINEFAPDVHLDVIAVEKDGEWYLSVGYTILENIRNVPEAEMGRPDFGRAYELVDSQDGGAETAEDAVRAFLTSAESLDYSEMIRLTDPLSLPYLHDYQPGIDDQINPQDVRDAANDIGLRIETLELGTSEWEGRTLVTVNELSGRVEGATFEVNTDTWCGLATADDGERIEGCLEEAMQELLFELDNFTTDPRDLVPEQAGIIVIERNGRFYVDPLGTMGFYFDEAAETLSELQDEFTETNNLDGGIADVLIVATGPILDLGESQIIDPIDGQVAVALDIRETASTDVPGLHLAMVEIDSDGTAELVPEAGITLDANERFVTFLRDNDNPIFPALVATSDTPLTVELSPVEIVRVTSDGWSGSIDAEGSPIVMVFDGFEDFDFAGSAAFETYWAYDDAGVLAAPATLTSGDPSRADFAVVTGEPGDSIEISAVTADVAPPADPPEETDEPESGLIDLGDRQANSLALHLMALEYDFAFDQLGGYFDGCGPDDPDVTSYAFEDLAGHRLLLTPYPTSDRADAAFAALLEMSSPCDAYPGLSIDEISIGGDGTTVQITLSDGENTEPYYEHYAVRDNVILVSTGGDVDQLLGGAALLDSWPN